MTDAPARRSPAMRFWLMLSLLWIAAVAYACFRTWPAMSLDMAAGDPQVQAAYRSAVMAHIVRHGLAAIIAPLLLLCAGMIGRRLGAGRP